MLWDEFKSREQEEEQRVCSPDKAHEMNVDHHLALQCCILWSDPTVKGVSKRVCCEGSKNFSKRELTKAEFAAHSLCCILRLQRHAQSRVSRKCSQESK